jgi:C-terminal processing protease CtpA/Prc
MRKKMFKLAHVFLVVTLLFVLLPGIPVMGGETTRPKSEPFDPAKKYAIKELKEDFQLLRTALEEGHGALYRYTPEEEMDRQFEAALKKLTKPMTEQEFYLVLAPVIASINCGHTALRLSESYRKHLVESPIFLPFKLKFLNGKAYMFRNYSQDPDVVMGGEVIAINQQPVKTIIEKMLKISPSDAHIQASKYRRLESTILFGTMYNLVFGKTGSYSLAYRPPGNKKVKTIRVPGKTRQQILSLFAQRYPEVAKERQKPPIELEYKKAGDIAIAVLTIRTFGGGAYKKAGISYPEFLEKAFNEFQEKKIQNLVIDLRNNGGGSDNYGKLLTAYFLDAPFTYYESLEVKQVKHSFWPHTNVPDAEQMLAARTKKNDHGTYDAVGHPNLGTQQPLKPTFKGKVYILINGGSFSASGECTSVIHFHKKAVFVGEECGAGYYGNTSGFMPLLTLPKTKMQIRIPLVKYSMAVSGYDKYRGIIPEYQVGFTIDDLLKDRDAVMEFTLDLIKKQK